MSFLVAAWNDAEDVPVFMAAYRGLTYPNRELVVCAGGQDDTLAVARSYQSSEIVVIEQDGGEGKQGALCKCFDHATGDLIYLTDIDCLPNDATVGSLVRAVVAGGSQVATGGSRPLEGQMESGFVRCQWAVERAAEPEATASVRGLRGANTVLTRQAAEASRVFARAHRPRLRPDCPAPTRAQSGTDYRLAKELLRADHSITYVPGFPMPSAYSASLRQHVRRQARWIRNVFLWGRFYGADDEVRDISKTVVLAYALPAAAILGLLRWRPLLTLSLAASAHAILNRLRYQKRAGVRLSLGGASAHFFATQVSAMRASIDLTRGVTPW